MRAAELRRHRWYEAMAKKHLARRVLIVGSRRHQLASIALARCMGMRELTVIASYRPREALRPSEWLQQESSL